MLEVLRLSIQKLLELTMGRIDVQQWNLEIWQPTYRGKLVGQVNLSIPGQSMVRCRFCNVCDCKQSAPKAGSAISWSTVSKNYLACKYRTTRQKVLRNIVLSGTVFGSKHENERIKRPWKVSLARETITLGERSRYCP